MDEYLRRFLLTKFSERGAKFSSLSGVFFFPKSDFSKGDGSHPLFRFFVVLVVVGGCYY